MLMESSYKNNSRYCLRIILSYFVIICLFEFVTVCNAQNSQNVNKNNGQTIQKNKDQIKKDKIRNLANELYLDNSEIGTSHYEDLPNNEITSIQLPPLSVLFQNMNKNPEYKQALIRYHQDLVKVGQQRRDPLDWISTRAKYDYGILSAIGTNSGTSSSSTSSVALISNNETRAYWSVGVEFSATFSDIFDYFSHVKDAKLQASYSKAQIEQAELDIKNKIIQIYLTIKGQAEELKVDNEMVNVYASTYKLAQGQFANGEQDATNLAEIKKQHALAVSTMERVKTKFISNLMLLELITHTKIR